MRFIITIIVLIACIYGGWSGYPDIYQFLTSKKAPMKQSAPSLDQSKTDANSSTDDADETEEDEDEEDS